MALIDNSQGSLADACIQDRKSKSSFLDQINKLLNWKLIQPTLEGYYPKGKAIAGRRAYAPLLLFKMSLLQTWYGLSDYQVEEEVWDSLSFRKFCGLSLQHDIPDHSVMSRFRKELTEAGGYEVLLDRINKQLETHQVIVKQGVILDASITPSPRKPKGKKVYHLPSENPTLPLEVVSQKGVDQQAQWCKRAHQLYYGYKRHYLVDDQEGMVLAVHTTSANAHESKHLGSLLEKVKLRAGGEVLADKGYSSAANEAIVRARGLKSRIQRRSSGGTKPSPWIGLYNRLIGRRRYKIERVFGSIKRWFKVSGARYVGIAKTHSQHVLEAISYNLYRAPNILAAGLSKG